MKIENLELNVNLENPVIFFDLNGTTCALLIDGSEKVLCGDMSEINKDLTAQLVTDQDYDTETTIYSFDDFSIMCCNTDLSYIIK